MSTFLARIFLPCLLVAACATPPSQAPSRAYYPPPPQPPRIQHLVTLSGERDFAPQDSGFAQFILGDDVRSPRLQRPYGVALFDRKLYVADTRAQGLAVFDFAQKRFTVMTGSGLGRMKRPINVRIDKDGTKYVTDTGRDQILVYDRNDRFVTAFGAEGQFKPVDTAISGDRLYVVDVAHHEVHALDRRSGQMLFKFGGRGTQPGELFNPTNIAIGPTGDLYVVETGNFRVQRFDAEGRSLQTLGRVGDTPGTFARPRGIAVDRAGRLYVGDAAFQNVQIFDIKGRTLLFFGQPDDGGEGLSLPAGISIDYDNAPVFAGYAHPGFQVEYVILVASQFGPNKVDVYGFGRKSGIAYPPEDSAKPVP